MWSGIWSVAATRIDYWTWIWSTRHYGLRQEVAWWFQCWKNNWFRLTGLITLILLTRKLDGSVFEETSSFRMLILSFFSKFEMSFFIISIAKTASQRIGAVIRSIFFLLRLLCISINLPYGLAWNTVVMVGWCSKLLLGIIRSATKADM